MCFSQYEALSVLAVQALWAVPTAELFQESDGLLVADLVW